MFGIIAVDNVMNNVFRDFSRNSLQVFLARQ